MSDDELTPKDYALLEAQRRGDMTISMKLGAIEGLEMTVKLIRAGLMERLDRKATLDEKEKNRRSFAFDERGGI